MQCSLIKTKIQLNNFKMGKKSDSDFGTKFVDLDHALSIAGIGWYNIKYSLVFALFLISAIIEPLGYSYILPAAKCDLSITDSQRGFISSVPYIAIVVTSFPWGFMVDTQGRKNVLMFSSLSTGFFGALAAFMPDLVSFTVCKLLSSLCIACAAAVPYTYIGEILPLKYRDITLSVVNSMQILGSAMVPLLAWGILTFDFRVNFGLYDFRPWRLLVIIYASFFILSAILLSFGPESPKYLISKGRHDEAMTVLKTIYAKNKGKHVDDYPVKALVVPENGQEQQNFLSSLKAQSLPIFKSGYLKWLLLNGFLLFGIFSVLNGLLVWIPDILNRVLSDSAESERTACQVIAERLNKTVSENAICDDTIDTPTFIINSVANVSCAFIAILISSSVKIIGKKTLLSAVYVVMGTMTLTINFITIDLLFAAFLSALPLTGLGIGPVNAFTVHIFPTHLRGMAVGLTMMFGRLGSVFGTNISGLLINNTCEATFYTFGGLLLLCGALSFLLPSSQMKKVNKSVGDGNINLCL